MLEGNREHKMAKDEWILTLTDNKLGGKATQQSTNRLNPKEQSEPKNQAET